MSIAHAESASWPDVQQLEQMSARFAPVDIELDLTAMPSNERAALADLVRAAQIMDALFLRQVSADNEATLLALSGDSTPLGRARLDYFLINKGPWSRLDADQAFLPGIGTKPDGASFYPLGNTKATVEAWLASLTEPQRLIPTGRYWTIRRLSIGRLAAVGYSAEYQPELQQAAQWLRSAADHTEQPTLKDYLRKRADAFASNNYRASDVAWMDLDATIEPAIGPYDVNEDRLFGYKAAFEAFIAVNDATESAKLGRFSQELQWLEDTLPIDAKYRRPKLPANPHVKAANLLFAAGGANRGIQISAYSLPNDEALISERGSKRVMLNNVIRAEFDRVLLASAKIMLAPADQRLVDFDPFIAHRLMRELMRGLGPQIFVADGRATAARQELKEFDGPLEEAKADISGLWALQQLINKRVLPKSEERAAYVTYLASAASTLRLGLAEAQAKGMALQLNYLLDAGAVRVQPDGTFAINFAKVKAAVAGLTHDIMTIQATGDYSKAKKWSEEMMVIRPEVRTVLDRLAAVPVAIRPRFVTAGALTAP
jgi:hypothetical protein